MPVKPAENIPSLPAPGLPPGGSSSLWSRDQAHQLQGQTPTANTLESMGSQILPAVLCLFPGMRMVSVKTGNHGEKDRQWLASSSLIFWRQTEGQR